MKIVFFGTPQIALHILEQLYKEHQVVAVVTAPDAPVGRKQVLTPSAVAEWAETKQLRVLKPITVKNNPELASELQALSADIFVVVAYGKILPLEIINLPRLKTVNVHFSLLPKYRGASPIQGALLAGDTETGTSIFILEAGMDTGPILGQSTISIDPTDDYNSLSYKLAELSANLMIQTLRDYDQGKIQPRAQDNTEATYTKIITKADGQINWDNNSAQIYNQFRAYKQWPGIWTVWGNQKLKILDCSPTSESQCAEPGEFQEPIICCGHQTGLTIKQVQLEGGKPQSLESFLNGHDSFRQAKLK